MQKYLNIMFYVDSKPHMGLLDFNILADNQTERH